LSEGLVIKKLLLRSSPLLALPLAACEGCIDLDGYRIIPADSATSSSGGAAGTSSISCNPASEGRIFAVAPAGASSSAAAGPCAATPGIGTDVFSLSPRDGTCEARARITLSGSTFFEQRVQVRHTEGNTVAVAGTFTGGELTFPLACNSSSNVVLAEPPLGGTSLYVARLRLEGSSFCTEWARRAWADNRAFQLHVHSFEHTADGSILVGGALGGPPTEFEGSDPRRIVTGGAFVARWSSSGALRSVNALVAGQRSFDGVLALAPSGGSFTAAGFAVLEDPLCHSCNGVSHVTNGPGRCPRVPDAGSDAFDASTIVDASFDAEDDTGGDAHEGDAMGADAAIEDGSTNDATGDAPIAPVPDTENAFVFTPAASGGCGVWESFGSDVIGADQQAIFGMSRHTASCGAYVAGMTGRGTWRLDGSDPRTTLASGNNQTYDGFIAHFDGGSVFGCPADGAPDFSLRLASAGMAVGGPLVARRCGEGVAATALVSAKQGSLALLRCTTAGGCDQASMVASLGAVVSEELVVMSLNGEGELDWHGAFGPVQGAATSPLSLTFFPPPID
jgi:hypothetical protein